MFASLEDMALRTGSTPGRGDSFEKGGNESVKIKIASSKIT